LAPGDLLASLDGQRLTAKNLDKVLSTLSDTQPCILCYYRDDLQHECMAFLEKSQLPAQYALLPNA
jgi:hypothetical protein